MSTRLSKMSLETPTNSSSFSEISDSPAEEDEESEEEDIFRPFSGKIRPGMRRAHTPSKRDAAVEAAEKCKKLQQQHKSLHRMNTSVKNDFWSVLRQNRHSTVDIPQDIKKGPTLAAATKIIMQEERVIKLFMKVDKLKNKSRPEGLPNI